MSLDASTLLRPSGALADGADPLRLSPDDAGWTYSGLRVLRLEPGEARTIATGDEEFAVLPLSGGGCIVEAAGQRHELTGRATVFDRVSDWCYVPIDTELVVTGAGEGAVEVALCSAKAEEAHPVHYGSAAGVSVEVRGGGQATRQINNFASPEQFAGAHRLMVVEVYTPDGNWSSYPPHKHDDSPECEVNNEEIYYFRIGGAGTVHYSEQGFGMHRTYTGTDYPGEQFEVNTAVRDGDLFLVPRGYHGPCIAAPGYTMYYLNVLAGPDGVRSMAFCDDPAHHWVRDELSNQPLDPRCPLLTADGPTFD